MVSVNALLSATDVPPIPAARLWAEAYDGHLGPLIDLAQAVPGDPPPKTLLDRLGAAARTPEAATYGPITGDRALRDALARDINGLYGAAVEDSEIAITAGCNQAFFVAMLSLAKAGDAVVLPVPWYFNHKMTLDMLGIAAVLLPCRAEQGFVPSVEEARRLIGPATRAIVLVTPNNPTGAVYPADVLAGFQELAREKDVALVVDETYRDFLPRGVDRPHDLFTGSGWRDTTIHLYSFSKSYAIPGHRLGAMLARRDLVEQAAKVLDCLQICPPRAAQAAIGWAVAETRDWREGVRATLNRRADVFRAVIANSPGWAVSAIGAYFAYVRHPFGPSGSDVAARLAREVGVLTLPGVFFGPGQDDHLRFAFANVDEQKLAAVAIRLEALAG